MNNCRNCDREGGGIPDGNKVIPRGCKQCLAETCILDGEYEDNGQIIKVKDNKMGFTTLEGAKKLCDCFAQGHPKKTKERDPSEQFEKNIKSLEQFKEKEIEKDTKTQQIFLDRYEEREYPERYNLRKQK